MNTLREDTALEDFQSTDAASVWIQVGDLTPLATATRKLLRGGLDERVFFRYTDPKSIEGCSSIFELQQKLHPNFKSPDRSLIPVVRLYCRSKGMDIRQAHDQAKSVNAMIKKKLRGLMIANADQPLSSDTTKVEPPPLDRLMLAFGPRSRQQAQPRHRIESIVDDELRRWHEHNETLRCFDGREAEGVLDFWRRLAQTGHFKIISKVVRILFAIPTSSAHIERDFSVCGAILTKERAAIASTTLDMCAFLNRNRQYVDLAQCKELTKKELKDHMPAGTTYTMPVHPQHFLDDLETLNVITDCFSNTINFDAVYGAHAESD